MYPVSQCLYCFIYSCFSIYGCIYRKKALFDLQSYGVTAFYDAFHPGMMCFIGIVHQN